MGFFRRLLGGSSTPPVEPAPVAQAVAVDNSEVDHALEVDPYLAAKSDGILDGWYELEAGTLYPGMPIDSSDTVLDVGCGESGVINFCASLGADVIYVDLDPAKVALKESQLQLQEGQMAAGYVSDASPLPLQDGVANRVISTEVLEHVDDPRAFLAELVRVGAPGARYMLSVPAPESEHLQKYTAAPSYFEKPNHIRIIAHQEFRDMVEDAGLVIESHDFRGFYWSLWWMFFWISDQDQLAPPWSPILESWSKTWSLLMAHPRAAEVKARLDLAVPKNQIIVAVKPL